VHWFCSLSPGGAGGVPGWGCAGRGGGAPVSSHLLCDCGFFGVPDWQGRQLSVWFWQIIAGCLSITAYILLYPRNSTAHFVSSQTSVRGFLTTQCVSSIAVCEYSPLAILATFKARCMLDCSSCTRHPCFAIVADMLKTNKKLVAASESEIRLLTRPYLTLYPPLMSLDPVSSTPGEDYDYIRPQQFLNFQYHEDQFCRQWGQMPWSTREVSHCGQR
jgi:hypothetical protein